MEIRIDRKELVKGLEIIKAVVPKKATMDCLSYVLIEAKDGECVLSGTDLIRHIEYRIPIDKAGSGKTLMPSCKLLAILKKRKNKDVYLEPQDEFITNVIFKGEPDYTNASFKLIGMDVEEFPETPKPIEFEAVSVKTDSFLDMVRKTSFAVASEETRYALNGIYMRLNGDFRMVATDGRRLSVVTREANVKSPEKYGQFIGIGVTVPVKTIKLLKNVLKGSDTFTFTTDEELISFETPNLRVASKLLAGNFPDYKEVIPEEFDHTVRFNKDTLVSLIEQATILGSDEWGGASRVKMSFSKDNVSLSSVVADVGETKLDLPVDFKDEPFDIRFDSKFLLEGLRAVKDDDITLRLGNDKSPVGMIEADKTFRHLIMGIGE